MTYRHYSHVARELDYRWDLTLAFLLGAETWRQITLLLGL